MSIYVRYIKIMMKIFPTNIIKELDQYTIQNEPINSADLVERAARVFVHEFCRRYSKQTQLIVFAGQGNNGADALAIARLLLDEGYRLKTYLFNPTNHLSYDCELNKQRLLAMANIDFTEVVDDFIPPVLTSRGAPSRIPTQPFSTTPLPPAARPPRTASCAGASRWAPRAWWACWPS